MRTSSSAGVAAFSAIHDFYYVPFAIYHFFYSGIFVPSTHSIVLITYNSNTMISTGIQHMYKLKSTQHAAIENKSIHNA
jgi:hypothetical protein